MRKHRDGAKQAHGRRCSGTYEMTCHGAGPLLVYRQPAYSTSFVVQSATVVNISKNIRMITDARHAKEGGVREADLQCYPTSMRPLTNTSDKAPWPHPGIGSVGGAAEPREMAQDSRLVGRQCTRYILSCSEEIPSSAKWDFIDARTSLTREPSEERWN